MTSRRLVLSASLAAVALPRLALAHTLPGAAGLLHGLTHPLTGADHILAMVAVGLWATTLGKRATWQVPAAFVGSMIAGGLLAVAGVRLPAIESGIAASVLILGLLLATSLKVPRTAAMALVGAFAVFHGQAHGVEMPINSSALTFAIGFAISTAFLHGVGIAGGLLIQRGMTEERRNGIVRFAGAAIALCGAAMWVA